MGLIFENETYVIRGAVTSTAACFSELNTVMCFTFSEVPNL